jgi:two-component system, cell cycle response regulator DivK
MHAAARSGFLVYKRYLDFPAFMPKTILIAASDPNITYLLQRYAEASGFQTVRASQDHDLQSVVMRIHPDLIVLEIELPEAPARLALRRLKADLHTADIPVVVYSCYDEVNCGTAEGAASCLQKSAMYSDFLAALAQAGVQPA